jgi:hypothetical protein
MKLPTGRFSLSTIHSLFQNLAWLSHQGYGSGSASEGKTLSSDHESDKENKTTTSTASSLPTVNMDIASRLQNALWAANFNKDQPYASPYGSWMNSALNPGFAAVAAAAAAAIKTSSNTFPSTTSSG